MANKETSDISIQDQLNQLVEQLVEFKRENKHLKRENKMLSNELVQTKATLENIETEYKRLKIARAYGWDEKSKREATDQMSRLIREIDRCLALLVK